MNSLKIVSSKEKKTYRIGNYPHILSLPSLISPLYIIGTRASRIDIFSFFSCDFFREILLINPHFIENRRDICVLYRINLLCSILDNISLILMHAS